MSVIKCKMCGGDLELIEGSSVAVCEYCGSQQTVPAADNEKKLTLFARANRLRLACEFDKAAGVYESIVADFPTEAEAYWGLVLCRYGIEYVDDPATGKKIPTCHRSSFDSVMEDSDFEQALENADAVARRVYRDEAKAIEELRRGIVEVSGKEPPYDIFICYKETAEDGQRTVDSVIAQDVYDALTEKGYRVFFSRISLEDKLGTEYEPYIFAALHSAKIMLAFGTDYEYYNAVWVKNEWSRFLQLMTKDKSKHLIPCYKNLDAYDMPKEFAKLQAQDMGKVGAMQDLLRGIGKILPKEQPAIVVQEKVVTGDGSNKITSLLDRGYMALEDGDWAKADSFFEDVLNNDSKNAQAYLGKTLAQEKCRTTDAFIRKRKNVHEIVRGETIELKPDTEHIDAAVKKFSIPGYVPEDTIYALYEFDRSFRSNVSERRQQYKSEEKYWTNHKQVSRAEKFATDVVAENLTLERKALFATLSDRVKKAEAEERAAKKSVQEQYAKHIQQADKQAEALYQAGLQQLLQVVKDSNNVDELQRAATAFDVLRNYPDSRTLAAHCRQRAVDEQSKLDAEAEQQRILREKEEKARAARNKKIGIFSGIAAMLIIAAVLVVTQAIIPNKKYNDAVALMETEQYEEAIAAFEAMGEYKDARKRILEVHYNQAESLLAFGKQAEAAIAFEAASDYRDAKARSYALWDRIAVRDSIATGLNHTVGLKTDGTVVAVGDNGHGQCDVGSWADIVAVSAGAWHTVGLKADGTVVAVGDNDYGQCNVDSWTDIVAVSTDFLHTVGLKADGTVMAVGDGRDGKCDVDDWSNIMAVSAGVCHTVGLRADGTVIAVGDNDYGQCNVSGWTDIVAVSAGNYHTVGLKSDGTVVSAGDNKYSRGNVGSWKNIVAVSAGENRTVGLKGDGTVVTVGLNNYDQYDDVEGWSNIVAISGKNSHTVGLRADGTVVAAGARTSGTAGTITYINNNYGQFNVGSWANIKVPE